MSKSIDALSKARGGEIYYDPGFCRFLENYIPLIKTRSANSVRAVDPHDVYVADGNFNSLMYRLQIHSKIHWITMRINGMKSIYELDESLTSLIVPDVEYLDLLTQKYTMSKD